MGKRLVKVYPRYERFWHWSQMALIFVLLFTGLGLNGAHGLIGFKAAVMAHTIAALSLAGLWLLTAFWMSATGTWRQFLPRLRGMGAVARYYAYGVFRGEASPYVKTYWHKHNPLQTASYFALTWLIFPLIWVTGILYLSYNFWEGMADSSAWLNIVANLHVLAAYVVLSFVIVHVYLLSVGGSFYGHIRPMLSGFDEIDLSDAQAAYLAANEPWRLDDGAAVADAGASEEAGEGTSEEASKQTSEAPAPNRP